MEKQTIEQKAAGSLLQQPYTLTLGGKKYRVARPSSATLVEVSAEISLMPETNNNSDSVLRNVLYNAKDWGGTGKVVATLFVGAKGMHTPVVRWIKKYRRNRLARKLMEDVPSAELYKALVTILAQSQFQDFFAVIAFLNERNLTKATTTTTASGQQSETL